MEAVCINIQSDKNHLVTHETLFIFVIIDKGFREGEGCFFIFI